MLKKHSDIESAGSSNSAMSDASRIISFESYFISTTPLALRNRFYLFRTDTVEVRNTNIYMKQG